MKKMINISGQQFYCSTIDQVIERCAENEKCAIIIDESHLDEFITKGEGIIGKCVNQIIVISENINAALLRLEGVNVLLVAVSSFEEAMKIAALGIELSREVICVPKEGEVEIYEIVDEIMSN